MKEKEPLVSSGDYGKDEDSAQVGPQYYRALLLYMRFTMCVCVAVTVEEA